MHPFKGMIGSVYDTQKFLFHYTSLETARDYILPNKTLRFSQQISLNDPKESKSQHLSGHGPKEVEFGPIRDRIIDYYLRNVKVCCFSRDDPTAGPPDQFPVDLFALGYMKQRM